MSYKVKAEDVTNKLLDDAYMHILSEDDSEMRHDIAVILNAAIDAGLVSPPCWIARASNGQLISGTVYPSREHAENYKWSSDNVEHWKGQTE